MGEQWEKGSLQSSKRQQPQGQDLWTAGRAYPSELGGREGQWAAPELWGTREGPELKGALEKVGVELGGSRESPRGQVILVDSKLG